MRHRLHFVGLVLFACALLPAAHAQTITIGSKNFTESYILSEIAAQLLTDAGFDVRRRFGLGGTKICYDALRAGEIDLYPEYSGTIALAILNRPLNDNLDRLLEPLGLRTLAPLGFNNSYVLALHNDIASARQIRRVSQLRDHPDLRIALSHEFRARADGWPAMAAHYALTNTTTGIEHGLAYQALASRDIDLTDAYATDGELSRYPVTLLNDDLGFFPRYDALWLADAGLPERAAKVLGSLSTRIDSQVMQSLNARAALDRIDIEVIARDFLNDEGLVLTPSDPVRMAIWASLASNTVRHVQLTLLALIAAAVIGIPLALLTQPRRRVAAGLLYACSLMQTIPSIALLALMIPLLGIGVLPALVALFLYALLPIVRASLTALNAIDKVHLTVADALGMTSSERRRYVLLPLAMPHIIAGLRTAAVISIGTATLAAFIGAGGLGQPIVTGLALNDLSLILQGAIPAALLAIATDLAFDALERKLVPAHLRQH